MKKFRVRFEGENETRIVFVRAIGNYRDAIDTAYSKIIKKYGEAYASRIVYAISVREVR